MRFAVAFDGVVFTLRSDARNVLLVLMEILYGHYVLKRANIYIFVCTLPSKQLWWRRMVDHVGHSNTTGFDERCLRELEYRGCKFYIMGDRTIVLS